MRKDKSAAIALRKQGKSYNEIGLHLGVPKSTLSDWLRDCNWSNEITKKLRAAADKESVIKIQELNKIRGEKLSAMYEQAEKEARQEFEVFKYHPLFLSGLSLYWGEGNKNQKGKIALGNTDPELIRVFVRFLEEICGLQKSEIHGHIIAYPEMNIEESLSFWVRTSGLSEENFFKTTIIQGRHKTRRLKYGICTVGKSSTYLKTKINVWMKLLGEELIHTDYKRI